MRIAELLIVMGAVLIVSVMPFWFLASSIRDGDELYKSVWSTGGVAALGAVVTCYKIWTDKKKNIDAIDKVDP